MSTRINSISDTAQSPPMDKGKRRLRQWLAKKLFGRNRSTRDLVLRKATGGKMAFTADDKTRPAGDHVLAKINGSSRLEDDIQNINALCGFKGALAPTPTKGPGSRTRLEVLELFDGYFEQIPSEQEDDVSILITYCRDATDSTADRPERKFDPAQAMMPYNIQELVGHGSQGVVYTVAHAGREYVAKLARTAVSIAVTMNEYIMMRGLKHQHVVQTVCPINGGFVMELIYTDLASLLDDGIPGSKIKLRVAAGVVHGVVYLHSRGIAHLDIKPANVLLDRRGCPKLADIGLSARFIHPTCKHTQLNRFTGTPTHMAPELMRYRCGGPCSAVDMTPVDVWACGCLMYQLLVGTPPFGNDTIQAIYTRQMTVLGDGLEFTTEAMPYLQSDAIARLLVMAAQQMLVLHPARRPTAAYMAKHYFGHIK